MDRSRSREEPNSRIWHLRGFGDQASHDGEVTCRDRQPAASVQAAPSALWRAVAVDGHASSERRSQPPTAVRSAKSKKPLPTAAAGTAHCNRGPHGSAAKMSNGFGGGGGTARGAGIPTTNVGGTGPGSSRADSASGVRCGWPAIVVAGAGAGAVAVAGVGAVSGTVVDPADSSSGVRRGW